MSDPGAGLQGAPRAGAPHPEAAPNAGRPLTAPPAPGEGRVWRRPAGRTPPTPRPTTPPPAGGAGGSVGRLLAVGAAAIACFAAGALLGGPLGLTSAPVPSPTPRTEAGPAPIAGAFADLLEEAGQVTVGLTDADGEPAGAVVLSPADRRMALVTRAELPAADAWIVAFERDGVRTPVGTLRTGTDDEAGGSVAWWIGALPDALPVDAGATGDRFVVVPEDRDWEEPLLDAAY